MCYSCSEKNVLATLKKQQLYSAQAHTGRKYAHTHTLVRLAYKMSLVHTTQTGFGDLLSFSTSGFLSMVTSRQ